MKKYLKTVKENNSNDNTLNNWLKLLDLILYTDILNFYTIK